MIGQLTDAGVAALQGNALVSIPLAKIGDGYNYIPVPADTDIHGNEVWRTQPSDPMEASPNKVRWSVYMDRNVGPFEFGEVGLYLPNGDLFALFAADELIEKINIGGANLGNEVNLLIFVSMVGDNYTIWLDLASTNNQLQVARVNSPDQLPQPKDAYPNIYIMPGADDNQQSILAVTDRQGLWAFGGYDLADTMRGTIVGFDSNSITIDAAEFDEDMIPAFFGQLILQFTTGRLFGICRYIKTTNQIGTTWRLSFNTPLVMTPDVGDSFFIQSRNPLTMESGNLPIATRSTTGVVIPMQSLTLDSTGRIGVDWTKLSLNGQPAVQNGDSGELTIQISQVGQTGQYSHLLNIPSVFAPVLATPTVRGGVKIAPGTGLYLDANEVLQIDTGSLVPDVIGLIAPAAIAAAADMNSSAYTLPGLYYRASSTGIVNKPGLPDAAFTLEVVPLSDGRNPGSVMQRWTQTDGGLATRYFNGTTWSAWVIFASFRVATRTATGVVQIGDNLSITPAGVVDAPVATQTTLGVVKGSGRVVVYPDGSLDVPGVLTTADVGIPGGVAGFLDGDPVDPPVDPDVSEYTYGRMPPEQVPLGFLNSFANWDAGANAASYTDAQGDTHAVTLLSTGRMTDAWDDGTAHNITVPANGKIFYVTGAGTTALDGVTSWAVGDLAVALGSTWVKISGGGAAGVASLNAMIGAITTANSTTITVATDTTAKTLTFNANVQQTINDTTDGRILTVGRAFGLGADNILDQRDLNDAQVLVSGFFGQAVAANATLARNYPVAGVAGTLLVNRAATGTVNQLYHTVTNDVYIRSLTASVWTPWVQMMTAAQKNQPNGFAGLDGVSKINIAQIPFSPVLTNATTSIALGSVAAASYVRTTSATAVTVNVAAGIGIVDQEWHFRQGAAGAITFTPAGGVTINAPFGGTLVTAGIGGTVTLKCVAANTYDLFGQVAGA